MPKSAQLKISPEVSLVDENCQITVSNLTPNQTVTALAVIKNDEDNVIFYSSAEFISDPNGTLDVGRSFSYNGTYLGIEPMGLFWSARPAPGQRKGMRLVKRNVDEPIEWLIFIVNGCIDEGCVVEAVEFVSSGENFCEHGTEGEKKSELLSIGGNEVIARGVAKRCFCYAEEIKCIDVEDGCRVKGTILFPKHLEKISGIENLSDDPGKTNEERIFNKGILNVRSGGAIKSSTAALLAQRGFVVFSLAHPTTTTTTSGTTTESSKNEITTSLSYLKESVDYMLSDKFPVHFDTDSGLGLIGLCKGGSMVLELGAFYPCKTAIRAIVSINPCCHHRLGVYRREDGGENISTAFTVDDSDVTRNEDGLLFKGIVERFLGKSPEERERYCIPVERVESSLLLIFGRDNLSMSPKNLDYLVERLNSYDRTNYKCLFYPGAGHLIETPNFPFCPFFYWSYFRENVVSGGVARLHHNAEVDSWRQILEFFKLHLNVIQSPD